ncbi:MAG: hypothetical protein JXO22_02140 [Phycisphaerae bacterium]|nr:hypothetical protein [Phycisphaerae bacterium]
MKLRIVIAATLCVAIIQLTACGRNRQKPNQKQPSVSPSGKYTLTVPIETNANQGGTSRWWTVTITDRNGVQLYKDQNPDFAGWLNAYWVWDASDRVWQSNSDDGRVFFWETKPTSTAPSSQPTQSEWTKTEWDDKDTELTARGFAPPAVLYPDYLGKYKQSPP